MQMSGWTLDLHCPNYFESFSHGFFSESDLFSWSFSARSLKQWCQNYFWFFVVLTALVMVDQTEGWRRRRRRRCHEQSCVVGDWGWWSSCSRSCGSWGVRTRSRTMRRYATCGGSCPYDLRETESCNRFSCPSKLRSSLITPLFFFF